MYWDELARPGRRGWEIGSHTRSHPHLTELDDATLAEELEAHARASRSASVAVPLARLSLRRRRRARGGRAAPPATRRGHAPGASGAPLAWPRVGVYHGDGPRRFAIKVAPLTRRAVTVTNRALDALGSSSTSS